MSVFGGIRNYTSDVWEAWNEFWFTPTNPSTLSAIRVFAGAMLFYTHLVWSFDLTDFFGQNGWLPSQLMHDVHQYVQRRRSTVPARALDWTLLRSHPLADRFVDRPHRGPVRVLLLDDRLLQPHDGRARYLFAVSYANRVTPGAYFGLDKINCHARHVPDGRAVRRTLLDRSHLAAAPRQHRRSAAERLRPISPFA